MDNYKISPSKLKGSLIIPPSKSHTMRAIIFGALAKGTSKIENFLPSPDTLAMIQAVRLLGATVKIKEFSLEIEGINGHFKTPKDVIHCGNSGLILRFIGALAALSPHYTILTGDDSIRYNRLASPLLSALNQLGAFATSSCSDGYAPLLIKGPLIHNKATLDGEDSQPISGLLIAGAFAPHPIELHVVNPGEKPWIDLTLDWFKKLNIPYFMKDYTTYRTEGKAKINGFTYTVPGDFSSAAFPLAAALLTNSELTLHNIDMSDVQGDKKLIPLLQKMGAHFTINQANKTLKVEKEAFLQGIEIDCNDCIDALPILAVIGCFAKGSTQITNGAIARKKESDRITSICKELKKMGALIEETTDGLIIHSSNLSGAQLTSHQDHRIAMSLVIASLAASSPSLISDVKCITKTYPHFWEEFSSIGSQVQKDISHGL